MTFCMLQKALGQNILLSSKRCSPASRRLGSRSTPANHVLSPTNLTIWVITSLVTELCPYERKSRQFKPSQFQKLAIIASVYRHDQLLPWHVAKALWASRPINCINFQKRQIQLERRAPKVFRCYQICDRTWSIVELPWLQSSVWNTYWCFEITTWRSHIPKGQAHCFLFTKDEQLPTKLHHDWEITPFHSGNSQGVP